MEYKFLIGEAILEKEYDNNKDMVFGNLQDSYKNLPLKTKVAYEYLASCHSPPKYFLLIDDDTWFAVEPIRKTLQDSKALNQIYGNMRRGSPRGPWSEKTKLVVNTTIWEPDKWPTWVDGPCTFMRGDAAMKIAKTASKTNWLEAIPVEDVFFSGIVRLKAKLKEPLTKAKFNPERIHCRHLKNNLPQLKKLMNYKPVPST
ncbi:Oidioi.mRNA.OKI2018_I69.PAR.g12686.t1.cds [Oikopleura dioica]|uniref:Hexosyltransferase n=1 Tax=Oikopleura dioica TaxID=34765 RepID=A0ABN7S5Q5_OIKDI|nr:Oidioi.mRNA.OKI2018_I69.PAR.g12686.t1.cds [Oikopleura dioica]